MDGFTDAVERLITEMETALKKHVQMFDDGYLSLREKELMDDNAKLCFRTKKAALFTEIGSIKNTSRATSPSSSLSVLGAHSAVSAQSGLQLFASSRWENRKFSEQDGRSATLSSSSAKRKAHESHVNESSGDESDAVTPGHAKRQKHHSELCPGASLSFNLNVDSAETKPTSSKPRPRKTPTKDGSSLARNMLPRSLVGWRKAKGMREHKGLRVFVNPHGRPYKAVNNPVLGEDFFLEPEDVLAYVEKHKLDNPIGKVVDQHESNHENENESESENEREHDDGAQDDFSDSDAEEEHTGNPEECTQHAQHQPETELPTLSVAVLHTNETTAVSAVASPICKPDRVSAVPRHSAGGIEQVPQVEHPHVPNSVFVPVIKTEPL